MTRAAGPGLCRRCGGPTGRARWARYCAACRTVVDAEQARAAHLRRVSKRGAARRLEAIRRADERFLAERTSRGLGFDPGAMRRRGPVPWEADE